MSRGRRVWQPVCFCALAVALFPLTAHAYQERATVVVLQPTEELSWTSWPEAEQRVLAELGAAGFDVEIEGAPATHDALMTLRSAARRHRALSAIRVARDGHGAVIDIWLEKPDPGALRKIRIPDVDQPESASTAGLESAELVHTSWLKIQLPERPAAPVVRDQGPQFEVEPVPKPVQTSRFSAAVGVGLVAPVSQIDPLGAVALSGRISLLSPFVLDADVWMTPFSSRIESDAGAVKLRAGLARAHLSAEPWPEWSVSPAIGFGAGGLLAWSNGEPAPGHAAVSDQTAVALLSARARLTFGLSQRVRLSWVGDAAYGIPDVVVRVEGVPDARLSRPLIDNFILLDWSWL